jgi:hypothetical protein
MAGRIAPSAFFDPANSAESSNFQLISQGLLDDEQFVIRREVFRMMQEAFSKNGIELAHRNMCIYFDPTMIHPECFLTLKCQNLMLHTIIVRLDGKT